MIKKFSLAYGSPSFIGIITEEDLMNYTVKKRTILQTGISSDLTLTTIGPPFEGAFLSHVANVLSG